MSDTILRGESLRALEAALPGYIRSRRWFGGKARTIRAVRLEEAVPLEHASGGSYIAVVRVEYAEGEPQRYVLPLGTTGGGNDEPPAQSVIATTQDVTFYDATFDVNFTLGLLEMVASETKHTAPAGEIRATHTLEFEGLRGEGVLEPHIMGAEQSNTSIRYGDRLILKLFRRLEEGTSPDLEVGRFLTKQGFANTPPLAGAVEYASGDGEPVTLAILQGFARNRGDAWKYTLESLEAYYRDNMAGDTVPDSGPHEDTSLLEMAERDTPEAAGRLVGSYLDAARLLGRRTAEMHLSLASDDADPAFSPEPFTLDSQYAMFHSMMALASEAFALLRQRSTARGETSEAPGALPDVSDVEMRFRPLLERPLGANRTRVHGDYHLGQVLYTGEDFMIIDFEGEPVRSLRERRAKYSPLKDVAGMLRSFHYATYAGLFAYLEGNELTDPVARARLNGWADLWHRHVGAAYLGEYLRTVRAARNGGTLLPRDQGDLAMLLDAYLVEKAVYELIYELNNRPDWVRIPLQGVAQLLG